MAAPLQTITLINNSDKLLYYDVSCASKENEWYKQAGLSPTPASVAANDGKAEGFAAACPASSPLATVILWEGTAKTSAMPYWYIAFDSVTGELFDVKRGTSLSYSTSIADGVYTLTMENRKYWWIVPLVLLLVVVGVVAFVLIRRRR